MHHTVWYGMSDNITTKPKPEYEHEQKTRNCLMCRDSFESSWAGERVCKRCKSSGSWRNGADFEAA